MKKTVCVVMIFCLIIACTNYVVADGNSTEAIELGEATTIDVSAYSKEEQVTSKIISVQIDWGNMNFKYTPAFKGNWNTETLDYDNYSPEKWEPTEEGQNTITIYNFSEVPVRASYGFLDAVEEVDLGYCFVDRNTSVECKKDEAERYYTDINFGHFQKTDGTNTGVYSSAVDFEVTSGKLPEKYINNSQKIGSITVTIAEVTSAQS